MNITDTMAGHGLDALRTAIAGQLFVPGEAGYDQARQAWNLAVDQRPAVVVEAGTKTWPAIAARSASRSRPAVVSVVFIVSFFFAAPTWGYGRDTASLLPDEVSWRHACCVIRADGHGVRQQPR